MHFYTGTRVHTTTSMGGKQTSIQLRWQPSVWTEHGTQEQIGGCTWTALPCHSIFAPTLPCTGPTPARTVWWSPRCPLGHSSEGWGCSWLGWQSWEGWAGMDVGRGAGENTLLKYELKANSKYKVILVAFVIRIQRGPSIADILWKAQRCPEDVGILKYSLMHLSTCSWTTDRIRNKVVSSFQDVLCTCKRFHCSAWITCTCTCTCTHVLPTEGQS